MGIEAIVAPMVAAAGTVSGGLAAQALVGGKGDEYSPTIEQQIAPALDFYKSAISQFDDKATQGLQYYQGALQQAVNSVNTGTARANQALSPYQAAGNNALVQFQKMLGLTPSSASAGLASQFGAQFGTQGAFGSISQQLQAAENITDPSQRAAARNQILSDISGQQGQLSQQQQQIQAQIDALGPRPGTGMTAGEFNSLARSQGTTDQQTIDDTYAQYVAQQKQQQSAYDTGLKDLQSQLASGQTNLDNLATFAQQYGTSYSNEAPVAANPEDINDMLAATPGYQFALNQGTQAVARSQAAKGMLSSANTQVAMQNYAQGLASTTFNNYMSQLGSLTGLGAAAAGQVSNNYQNQGNTNAQLQQNAGNAYLNAYLNMASNAASQTANMGSAWLNTYSQQQQQNNQMAMQQLQGQQQLSAIGLSQGMQMAQQNQSNYLYGQGFLSGQGGRLSI